MRRYEDLTGKKFNMLTVIREAEPYISPKGRMVRQWLCHCDCGNESVVRGQSLRNGTAKSCGCLLKEAQKTFGQRMKKYNKYEFKEDYVIGYTAKGETFIFDREDYERVKNYCWYMMKGYAWTNHYNGEQNHALHRLILDAKPGQVVDHINHCTWDNRKCNLRVGSQLHNQKNKGPHKNNRSGMTGVSWDDNRGCWRAHIIENGRYHTLGRFENFNDAVAARKAGEHKYFGEYAYDASIAAVPRIEINPVT